MSFVIYHQAVTQGLHRVDTGRERLEIRELWGLQTDGSIPYPLYKLADKSPG